MCLYNVVILALTVLEIYSSEAAGFGIFDRFLHFDNCQTEVVSDVISGVVVDPINVKTQVKFADSMSNRSRDIRLPLFVGTTTTTTTMTTPAYAGHHIRAKQTVRIPAKRWQMEQQSELIGVTKS